MTKPKWKKEVYGMMKQLECVRCESRIGLGPYTISYQQYAGTTRSGNVRTTHYKVHSFPIPICAECRKKLDNWKTLNGLLRGFFFWVFLCYYMGLFLLF